MAVRGNAHSRRERRRLFWVSLSLRVGMIMNRERELGLDRRETG